MFQVNIHKLLEQFSYNPKEPLIFSTGLFLFLFLAFITVFYLGHKLRGLKWIYTALFAACFAYYSNIPCALIFAVAITGGFFFTRLIPRAKTQGVKNLVAALSLLCNISVLACAMATGYLQQMLHHLQHDKFSLMALFMPVSLSFFTFQSVRYTIEVYMTEIKAARRFIDYLFFHTFYPAVFDSNPDGDKKHDLKLFYVIAFSLFFYYKSSGIYFLLLVLSTVVDYNLANFIDRAKSQGVKLGLLIFSLVLNLGLLGYFKYTNFLYEIFCNISGRHFDPFSIFLPVGVSFFTFQSLSYTIDIYRKEIKPVGRILDYAFFVSFFPQLVAGPIVRARDFIPQISLPTVVTRAMFGQGIFLIVSGLFKKAVISDYISANFVDRIFDNPTLYTGLENLFGVYGYAMQIYCDFSGYSDMAIGIALLFGYRLTLNFDSPYQSSSITEFWRRWHISLSTWLRDYLYISLGGNRKGKFRTYLNQFLTMLLGGLWHGAAFRFIIWGALHGVALGIDKFIKSLVKIPDNLFFKVGGILLTFHFVCFCWIFFRADDMSVAGAVLSQIGAHFTPSVFLNFIAGYNKVLLVMLLGYLLHFIPRKFEWSAHEWVTNMPLPAKVAIIVVTVVLVIQVKGSDVQPFIYFQF